ncbi:MAG: hypothetical protein HXS54_15490 [Theionarchaea archaeon]|nr:hypothetical protein [Theionarchaea archaeon]
MTKTITITLDVPDWVGEIKLKEGLYDLAKEFSDRYYKIKRLKEIAEELNLDEKELEKFEESREEAWKDIKREYG